MTRTSNQTSAAVKHSFIRTAFFLLALTSFAGASFGQTCTSAAVPTTVHNEGLSELIGNISVTCSGGSGTVNTIIAVTLNANVTNRLDSNGNLLNVALTGSATSLTPPIASSAKTVLFSSVQFTAGASVGFTISGIRVAVPTISGGGATPGVTANVVGNFNGSGQPIVVAIGASTLASSVFNYGIPCLGSAAPSTNDFPGLISAGTVSSTVRVTEASPAAFGPKTPGADFGVRFLINITGYGSNATVYVPDVIVGNRGTAPTTAGAFGFSASGGTYTPGLNQLLLVRVNGADATGNSGTTFLLTPPAVATSFTSVTQIPLVNGAASVTYEVLDANPGLIDSAQIPVYVVVPPSSCSAPLANTLGATLAPASTVTIPSQTDPIPRYVSFVPGPDCLILTDCNASYFPVMQVSPTSLTLSAPSLGQPQVGLITLTDGGSNAFNFTVTTAYQTASGLTSANWLTVDPLSGLVGPGAGVSSLSIGVTANPAALLVPGAYQATVTIDAGAAGKATVPVTFNVGTAGPTIQSIVNSASFQAGPVTVGSFVTIFGQNLVPKNSPATVTFDGFPGTISYDGQPSVSGPAQINVLVPASLGQFANAGVVATIDGVASNTYAINLVQNAPAVFNPGVLNQNNSVNLASAPASRGDIIQIFLTGLATPVNVPVTVTLGTQSITGSQILYAGPVVSIPGLEQVNVQVPPSLSFTGNSVALSICVPGAGDQPACSPPVSLYLQQ